MVHILGLHEYMVDGPASILQSVLKGLSASLGPLVLDLMLPLQRSLRCPKRQSTSGCFYKLRVIVVITNRATIWGSMSHVFLETPKQQHEMLSA